MRECNANNDNNDNNNTQVSGCVVNAVPLPPCESQAREREGERERAHNKSGSLWPRETCAHYTGLGSCDSQDSNSLRQEGNSNEGDIRTREEKEREGEKFLRPAAFLLRTRGQHTRGRRRTCARSGPLGGGGGALNTTQWPCAALARRPTSGLDRASHSRG